MLTEQRTNETPEINSPGSIARESGEGFEVATIRGVKKVREKQEIDLIGQVEIFYNQKLGIWTASWIASWTPEEGTKPTQFLLAGKALEDSMGEIDQEPYSGKRTLGLTYHEVASGKIHNFTSEEIDLEAFEEPETLPVGTPEENQEGFALVSETELTEGLDSNLPVEEEEKHTYVSMAQLTLPNLTATWEQDHVTGEGMFAIASHLDLADEFTQFIVDHGTSIDKDTVRRELTRVGALAQARQREIAAEMAQATLSE